MSPARDADSCCTGPLLRQTAPVASNESRLRRARPVSARRLGFQDMLRRDTTEIPDPYFQIERLVVQGDQVACRIRFDCTSESSLRGYRGRQPADLRAQTSSVRRLSAEDPPVLPRPGQASRCRYPPGRGR
ncbi:ester cyclase [Streptomyces sp. BBFR51]|uniref:ester cyclase n=1 Tax=Streptomyces sp. BBFR51 TaxID=3372856 RepID=UPI0037DD1601